MQADVLPDGADLLVHFEYASDFALEVCAAAAAESTIH